MLRAGPRRQCGFFAWGCGLEMEWSGVGGKRVLGRGSVSESERVRVRDALAEGRCPRRYQISASQKHS